MENTEFENPAQTMQKMMENLGHHDTIEIPETFDFNTSHLVTIPNPRSVQDLTSKIREAAEYLKPARRKGTATLSDLDSLIAWANRFKGETSVLYAKPVMADPRLTCIADYHHGGEIDNTSVSGDPTASHCHHRAVYTFPLSNEWKAWMAVTGKDGQPPKAMSMDEIGEFIELHALDIMDPTSAINKGDEHDDNEKWENRLIQTSRKIEGKFGQLTQFLAMSKKFQIHETSNLTIASNRNTGEKEIQFVNEHKTADGQPLKPPSLMIIAIPVFLGGAPYRMAVRFRYTKTKSGVAFTLQVLNPEKVFEAAFGEAIEQAVTETELPIFLGSPEN